MAPQSKTSQFICTIKGHLKPGTSVLDAKELIQTLVGSANWQLLANVYAQLAEERPPPGMRLPELKEALSTRLFTEFFVPVPVEPAGPEEMNSEPSGPEEMQLESAESEPMDTCVAKFKTDFTDLVMAARDHPNFTRAELAWYIGDLDSGLQQVLHTTTSKIKVVKHVKNLLTTESSGCDGSLISKDEEASIKSKFDSLKRDCKQIRREAQEQRRREEREAQAARQRAARAALLAQRRQDKEAAAAGLREASTILTEFMGSPVNVSQQLSAAAKEDFANAGNQPPKFGLIDFSGGISCFEGHMTATGTLKLSPAVLPCTTELINSLKSDEFELIAKGDGTLGYRIMIDNVPEKACKSKVVFDKIQEVVGNRFHVVAGTVKAPPKVQVSSHGPNNTLAIPNVPKASDFVDFIVDATVLCPGGTRDQRLKVRVGNRTYTAAHKLWALLVNGNLTLKPDASNELRDLLTRSQQTVLGAGPEAPVNVDSSSEYSSFEDSSDDSSTSEPDSEERAAIERFLEM